MYFFYVHICFDIDIKKKIIKKKDFVESPKWTLNKNVYTCICGAGVMYLGLFVVGFGQDDFIPEDSVLHWLLQC